jgi:AGCS family alanine or glycine:cation symporter
MGTTCNINASSSAEHPCTQGILGMCGVFVDTIIVCTATGLIILLSGAYGSAESGAALTQAAFGTFMGSSAAPIFVAVVLFFFAFTSTGRQFLQRPCCGAVPVWR